MNKNPYDVLEIPIDSSIDQIKKAFRNLIRTHHPDINGGDSSKTQEIINAYHKLMQDSVKKNNEKSSLSELFYIAYEMYFEDIYRVPSSKILCFMHIKRVTENFRSFLYSEKNFDFFDEYISALIMSIEDLRKRYKESWLDTIYAILENYKYLLIFRRDILTGDLHKNEYELEKMRTELIKYFQSISRSSQYLELRSAIFSIRDSLIVDCVQSINRINSRPHRQELFSCMSLIMLYSEEDFFENWQFKN